MRRSPIAVPPAAVGMDSVVMEDEKDVRKWNTACFVFAEHPGGLSGTGKAHPDVLQTQVRSVFGVPFLFLFPCTTTQL